MNIKEQAAEALRIDPFAKTFVSANACVKCGRNVRRTSGSYPCVYCCSVKNKKWARENNEKAKKDFAAWYQKNKAYCLAKDRANYLKRKELKITLFQEFKMKKAIFLYDFTGLMAKPWIDAGYECWCFDGQHKPGVTRDGLHVKVGMWFYPQGLEYQSAIIRDLVGDGVEMVFGFPECTHLAVSGAAHFASKLAANPNIQNEATELAKLVQQVGDACGCPWGAENPVSVLSSLWRKPDFSFHPWEYGGYLPDDDTHPQYPEYIKPRDAYPKKTCIWSGNGFIEPKRKPVFVDKGYSDQHKKLGGKSLKTKNIRSATPRGFAIAVFEANKMRECQ